MHETFDHLRIIQKFKIFEIKSGPKCIRKHVSKESYRSKRLLMFHYQVYFTRYQSVLNFSTCLQNVSRKVTKNLMIR